MRGSSSSLACAVHTSHHLTRHLRGALILFDFSTFLFLLSTFSPIVLFLLLAINYFFHDVVDSTSDSEDLGTLAEYDPLTLSAIVILTC